MANPIVALDASSMYIATSQIFALPGKFHWVIYITDAMERVTTYQWNEVPSASGSPYYESVQIDVQNEPIKTFRDGCIMIFAFFKILGYREVAHSEEIVREIAGNAFNTLGYKTLKENRNNGLTCRTWVMRVIEQMKAKGILDRDESAEWFEKVVARKTERLRIRRRTISWRSRKFLRFEQRHGQHNNSTA